MLTIEEIREALRRFKATIVADETGLHINTVRSVIRGGAASYETVKTLSDWLQRVADEVKP